MLSHSKKKLIPVLAIWPSFYEGQLSRPILSFFDHCKFPLCEQIQQHCSRFHVTRLWCSRNTSREILLCNVPSPKSNFQYQWFVANIFITIAFAIYLCGNFHARHTMWSILCSPVTIHFFTGFQLWVIYVIVTKYCRLILVIWFQSWAWHCTTWAKTINVFRACLGAQLTICAQKWRNFVLFSMVSFRFVLSRVCVFLYSLGPLCRLVLVTRWQLLAWYCIVFTQHLCTL